MNPCALIVSEKWGMAVRGGVSAAIHLLARLLHSAGFVIYCTVLKATDLEQAEADQLGVQLLFPSPIGRLRHRKPHPDWLLSYRDYFPNILELDNVNNIFGIGLVTSDVAVKMKQNEFSNSVLSIINVWSPDSVAGTLAVIGCDVNEFEDRRTALNNEFEDCRLVLSLGFQTFEYFNTKFRSGVDIKHLRLFPSPEMSYFDEHPLCAMKDIRLFQILSMTNDDNLNELGPLRILAKAMNEVAKRYHDVMSEPPTWKILGVPAGCEDKFKAAIDPHPQLRILTRSISSVTSFNSELQSSQLVLIHPSAEPSLQFALTAMAVGVPILAPRSSETHSMMSKYIEYYEDNVIVPMIEGTTYLVDKIMRVLKSHDVCLAHSSEIKHNLQHGVLQSMHDQNQHVLGEIIRDTQKPVGITQQSLHVPMAEQKTTNGDGNAKTHNHRQYHVGMTVSTGSGIPVNGKTMAEVTNGFENCDMNKHVAFVAALLTKISNGDLQLVGCHKSAISMTFLCKTSTALRYLWDDYQSGRLNSKMEDIFLTDDILKEIGAVYLTLITSIDIEEYEVCMDELLAKENDDVDSEAQGANTSKEDSSCDDKEGIQIGGHQHELAIEYDSSYSSPRGIIKLLTSYGSVVSQCWGRIYNNKQAGLIVMEKCDVDRLSSIASIKLEMLHLLGVRKILLLDRSLYKSYLRLDEGQMNEQDNIALHGLLSSQGSDILRMITEIKTKKKKVPTATLR